jgi:hypothetical protein
MKLISNPRQPARWGPAGCPAFLGRDVGHSQQQCLRELSRLGEI